MPTAFAPATPAEQAEAAEWWRRELCGRDLHYFVRQAWKLVEPNRDFRDNWHIRAECDHLMAVSDGRLTDLLANVPPGTMKSLLVNVFWFCWEWSQRPGGRWLFASYNIDLSKRDLEKAKNIVNSQWFQERWGSEAKARWGELLADDYQGVALTTEKAELLKNNHGGFRIATSIGGGATGEHPDRVVVDDPHKVLEAESDVERKGVVTWWDETMTTRGAMAFVGVRRVLIMQRLHHQDLAAHWLAQAKLTGRPLCHLCLPMRYEAPERNEETGELVPRMPVTALGWQDPRKKDGELLWPEAYPETTVVTLEATLGLYGAAGQLQQRPSPRGGGQFERAWFRIMPHCPPLIRAVRYWDKAGTKGGTGAESAGVVVAEFDNPLATHHAYRRCYIIADAISFREKAAVREQVINQTADVDRTRWGCMVTTWVEEEPGSGGKESAENTVALNVGHHFMVERVTGSKEVRAQPMASQASVGKVFLLAGAWNGKFLNEVEAFPVGKLKDLVDAASGGINKLIAPAGAFRPGDLPPAKPRDPHAVGWPAAGKDPQLTIN